MSEARAQPGDAGHPLLDITKRSTARPARRWRALRAAAVGALGSFAVLGAGQLGAPPAALALLAAAGALAIAALLDRDASAPPSAALLDIEAAATAFAVPAAPSAPASPPAGAASPPADAGRGAAALMHDLRAPLLSARATLELLVEGAYGDLERPAREAAERGAIAAARAFTLVDRFQEGRSAGAATRPADSATGASVTARRARPTSRV